MSDPSVYQALMNEYLRQIRYVLLVIENYIRKVAPY